MVQDFTGFHWVRRGFSWILQVLFCVELALTGLYWVLLSFTGFYWVLLGFIGFYWVLLGFTGFYWVLHRTEIVSRQAKETTTKQERERIVVPSEPSRTWSMDGPVETRGNLPVLCHSPAGVTARSATTRSSMLP